jgi:sugar phosphate isomerase/epimerase
LIPTPVQICYESGVSVALQLYTVRRELALDFPGTLRRIRQIGYRAVETYPFEISDAEAAEYLAASHLEVVAMHCDLPLHDALARVLEAARAFRCQNLIWHGWPRSPEHASLEGIQRLAALYNQASTIAREHGLQLGLHNHWWEFEPLNGVFPYKILHELLHPHIFQEIDTYWVKTAGLDPAQVIAELGPRVKLLHLKDGPAVQGRPMTPLGQGVLDFRSILIALPSPVDLVVELDECATDIFDAIEVSLRYLSFLENNLGESKKARLPM